MGISRNGTIDRERTEELKLARDDDVVDDCAREARGMRAIREKCLLLFALLKEMINM